jgi:hypothetical protein
LELQPGAECKEQRANDEGQGCSCFEALQLLWAKQSAKHFDETEGLVMLLLERSMPLAKAPAGPNAMGMKPRACSKLTTPIGTQAFA